MRSYPHMCRMDHVEIGHAMSDEDERCPLCLVLDENAALRAMHNEARRAYRDLRVALGAPYSEDAAAFGPVELERAAGDVASKLREERESVSRLSEYIDDARVTLGWHRSDEEHDEGCGCTAAGLVHLCSDARRTIADLTAEVARLKAEFAAEAAEAAEAKGER